MKSTKAFKKYIAPFIGSVLTVFAGVSILERGIVRGLILLEEERIAIGGSIIAIGSLMLVFVLYLVIQTTKNDKNNT